MSGSLLEVVVWACLTVISRSLNDNLLENFDNFFVFFQICKHRYETVNSEKDMPIKVISFISKPYGKEAIIYSTISTWIILKTVQAIFCCIVLLPSAFMFHACCLQCLYACVFSPLLVSQLTHIFLDQCHSHFISWFCYTKSKFIAMLIHKIHKKGKESNDFL